MNTATTIVNSPFRTALRHAIAKAIKEPKADGIISKSVASLLQCVRPPSSGLEGAPLGTNSEYVYAQIFREMCEEPQIRAYILTM